MRFTSIPVVLAIALTLTLSLAAKGQALPTADSFERPLLLKTAMRIEPRLARQLPADSADDTGLALQPETQLPEIPPLGAVSSRAVKEESLPTDRPWFDRVRPLLEMSR